MHLHGLLCLVTYFAFLFTLLVFSIKSVCAKFQVGYPHKFRISFCLRGPEVLTLFEDERNEKVIPYLMACLRKNRPVISDQKINFPCILGY